MHLWLCVCGATPADLLAASMAAQKGLIRDNTDALPTKRYRFDSSV